jgi:hypothetical protein
MAERFHSLGQRIIPDPPSITDAMARGADGTDSFDLIGEVVTVYDIPDSDRGEKLVLYRSGRVMLISCDPGYDANDRLDPTRWEIVLYDATDTPAGREIKKLEPGQWL